MVKNLVAQLWYKAFIKTLKRKRSSCQKPVLIEKSSPILPLKQTSTSQKSIILALLQEKVNCVVSRDDILQRLGKHVGDWRRNISTLRDEGYVIWGANDHISLKKGQYILKNTEKIYASLSARKRPCFKTQMEIREKYGNACNICNIQEGDMERGRIIKLVFDHATPQAHQTHLACPEKIEDWVLLCEKHNNQKSSFWDDKQGKAHLLQMTKNACIEEKRVLYDYLKTFFQND